MPFWVDHRPRIEYYVRQGLVRRMPSDAQLREVSRLNLYGAGVVERIRFYARHPLDLLPTAAKKRGFAQTNQEVLAQGTMAARSDVALQSHPLGRANDALLDRSLRSLFHWSPARFAVQCAFNPWNPIPTTGLNIPARYLISHVVHAPHPTAVWDVQILHPDPGALDELERQIELADRARGLRWRIYRAMAQRPGYYDYLRDLVPRIRRFDYPPTPPGFSPILENLVNFLNHACEA
jgi:hypothetical protein